MPEAEDPSLPTLFPSKLLDCCLETVQRMVLMAGTRTERRAKLILERDKRVLSHFEIPTLHQTLIPC